MLFRPFNHFMLFIAILGDFHAAFTRFEPLGTQDNTGGMDYDNHPCKGMLIRFFDHFMLIYRDFRPFSHRFHAFRTSRNTRQHRRDGYDSLSLQNSRFLLASTYKLVTLTYFIIILIFNLI